MAIEDGGRKLIRVADDGAGIPPDELALAVAPHATSKIADEADLERIGTLGFRGEALASIASVSQVRIVSRRAERPDGAEIHAAGGGVEPVKPAGGRPGTIIEVRNLFYNTPARRKFLRAASTELNHVTEQLTRMALPNPSIGLELRHNDRVVREFGAAATLAERVHAFAGEELAGRLIAIDRTDRGTHIVGFVAPPDQSRSSGNWQYVFLNGRYIRDRFIHHAIREAYRGLVEPQRWPVVFLFLSMDPTEFDINVHPTKIEVRWRDGNSVHGRVLAAIRERFLTSDLTPDVQTPGGAPPDDPAESERRHRIRQAMADFFKSLPATQPHLPMPAGTGPDRPRPGGRRPGEPPPPPTLPLPAPPEPSTMRAEQPATGPAMTVGAVQLHNAYLVTADEDGILVIDQHALHERILYEELLSRLNDGRLQSQRLLMPETVAVSPRQMAAIDQAAELLERLGIELTAFGADAVAVQAFPTVLDRADVGAYMRDLIDTLVDKGEATGREELLEAVLSVTACKAAVKAGDPLSPEEIASLLARRTEVERSSNCPHGRPTTLRLTLAELEKQFGRT